MGPGLLVDEQEGLRMQIQWSLVLVERLRVFRNFDSEHFNRSLC